MRQSTKALVLSAALIANLLALGCHDDEQTLYIEHAKSFPSPPDCEVTVSDSVISAAPIDLSLANNASVYFLVSNSLVVREEYDNLTAESNGVFIDGFQTRFVVPGQGGVGATESFQLERYIPPETSDVVPAIIMSPSVGAQLRDTLGCSSIYDSAYYSEIVNQLLGIHTEIPGSAGQMAALQAFYENVGSEYYGLGYAYVKFIGHTQGGIEIETPEFTMPVDLCCNCFVEWGPCASDADTAFCEGTQTEMCQNGVGGGASMTCGEIISDAGIGYWDGWVLNEEDPLNPVWESVSNSCGS